MDRHAVLTGVDHLVERAGCDGRSLSARRGSLWRGRCCCAALGSLVLGAAVPVPLSVLSAGDHRALSAGLHRAAPSDSGTDAATGILVLLSGIEQLLSVCPAMPNRLGTSRAATGRFALKRRVIERQDRTIKAERISCRRSFRDEARWPHRH